MKFYSALPYALTVYLFFNGCPLPYKTTETRAELFTPNALDMSDLDMSDEELMEEGDTEFATSAEAIVSYPYFYLSCPADTLPPQLQPR